MSFKFPTLQEVDQAAARRRFDRLFKDYIFHFMRMRVLVSRYPSQSFAIRNCNTILTILKWSLLDLDQSYFQSQAAFYQVY